MVTHGPQYGLHASAPVNHKPHLCEANKPPQSGPLALQLNVKGPAFCSTNLEVVFCCLKVVCGVWWERLVCTLALQQAVL